LAVAELRDHAGWLAAAGGNVQQSSRPQRIAILGGGVASLATAYELSSQPDFASRYELTVYQQGHRLGGKAASARARVAEGVERIEEHGLHMFFGFYENAFDLMRRCYRDLERLPPEADETWRLSIGEAFFPHDLIMLGSSYRGRVRSWALPFPRRDGVPGVVGTGPSGESPSTLDAGTMLGGLCELMVAQLLNVADIQVDGLGPSETGRGDLQRELAGIERRGADGADLMGDILGVLTTLRPLLRGRLAPRALVLVLRIVQAMLARLGSQPLLRNRHARILLASILAGVRDQALRVLAELPGDDFRLHQFRVSLDLFFTLAVGLLRDDLLHPEADWFALDAIDYRTWMQRHGARPETVVSAPLLTLADATFSDPKSAGAGAGTTLHLTLRMLLTYKQAIVFRLGAGMGETVVAPLYRVLEARGVRFKFFHRVERLLPGERDGRPVVASIEFRRQARVRAGAASYRALTACADGMLCFPSTPDFAQLVEGEELKRRGIDLEDSWNAWDPQRPIERLTLGRDFDAVVLGVSVGGLGPLCAELARDAESRPPLLRAGVAAPRLGAMLANVRSIETMAAQLWFKGSFADLDGPSAAGVGVEYAQPFDTWSEMNHLLPHERWRVATPPRGIVYLCSAVDEPAGYTPPPFSDHEHSARRRQEVKLVVRRWLDLHGARLFAGTGQNGRFDYQLLVDPSERQGSARFEAQYWCATTNPSDRYVLSAPGTNSYRLRPHESGFDNLVLTGDWTLNAISAGCVEGTVMSGKEAARALCGAPRQIVGDWLTRVHPELLGEPILPRLPASAPAPDAAGPAHPPSEAPLAFAEPTSNDNSRRASSQPPRREPSAGLPSYHKRPFDILSMPPTVCQGARADWFFFAAERAPLVELCAELNHPDSPTLYEPLLPLVAFVAASVARIYPGSERAGFIPERDFAFWVPVRASARPGREADHVASPIAWYQPCLWVDSCPAAVGGREIFGMNKVLGLLRSPDETRRAYSIDTIAIARSGPESEAKMHRLLELTVAREPRGLRRLSHVLELWQDAAIAQLLEAKLNTPRAALGAWLDHLRHAPVPLVGLKQLPDLARPDRACYKAVVESNSRTTGGVALWPWPGEHRLRLYPLDSHPIARLLGLPVSLADEPGGPVEVAAPFFAMSAEFDFVLEPGKVVFDFVAAAQQRDGVVAAE
jgi:uncharacterized protein with NAD-binding domain and iron-sulfur cluster